MDPLAVALLDREANVRELLLDAVSVPGRSRVELTFNVTNLLIDFEGKSVTVDDELDPEVSVVVTLTDFLDYLG